MGTAPSTQATTEAPGVRQDETAYAPPRMYLRWRPVMTDWETAIDTGGRVPELVVAQSDLTECEADAIVNPANSSLDHAGGAAAAIRHKGGRVIDDESQQWIDANKQLPVGHAMVTTSGRLPCRYVIHTVGPRIHSSQPTAEEAQQLRDAVKSALLEAERLGLASIALPGISSGIFGYPRDLATQEIVQECVRFCRDRGTSMDRHGQTTLTTIVFLNVDLPTCKSFAQALQDAANEDGKGRTSPGSPRATVLMDAAATATNAARKQECDQRVALRNPSSGILLARVGEKDFEVLLGVEFRLFRSKLVTVVGTREGDIGSQEESEDMAICRRLAREVNGLLSVSQLQNGFKRASRSVQIPRAKFTLHIVHLDTKQARSLPEAYERSSGGSWYTGKPDHLVWVPWRALVDTVMASSTSATALPSSRGIKFGSGKLRTPFGMFQLSPFVSQFVKRCGDDVERHLEDLLTETMIPNEVARVDLLRGMDVISLVNFWI